MITNERLDEIEHATRELQAHNERVRKDQPDNLLSKFIEGALAFTDVLALIAEVRELRSHASTGTDIPKVSDDDVILTVTPADARKVEALIRERDAARAAVDKYKKELATAWTETEAARASEKAMGAQLTEADREVAQMEAFAEMVVGRLVTAGHDYSRDYHLTGCEGCRNLVASIEALYAATPPAETKESDK